MELRHPSWQHDVVFALLERHGAAYCVMSGAGLPCVLRATAPFVYVRLHGPDHGQPVRRVLLRRRPPLVGRPDPRVAGQGRDVYAYFNNDGHGHAVRNALRLRQLLS